MKSNQEIATVVNPNESSTIEIQRKSNRNNYELAIEIIEMEMICSLTMKISPLMKMIRQSWVESKKITKERGMIILKQ
jgi:hypothetical protein